MKEGHITVAELGPRLKLIRQELGITQKDLAQALDLNQAILSKFENGGMVYASVLLDVLCFFRGISISSCSQAIRMISPMSAACVPTTSNMMLSSVVSAKWFVRI